jgi:hypothetical protein
MNKRDRKGRRQVDTSVDTTARENVADWQRPPFAPGHELSRRHGAYSPREIEKRAEVVHEHLLEIAPWAKEEVYAPSVNRYMQATAREQLAHEALMNLEPGARGFTRLLETATAAARLAWAMGDALGLTPGGHAKLKQLVAGAVEAEHTIADLAAEGRRARQRAESRTAADVDGTADDEEEL